MDVHKAEVTKPATMPMPPHSPTHIYASLRHSPFNMSGQAPVGEMAEGGMGRARLRLDEMPELTWGSSGFL